MHPTSTLRGFLWALVFVFFSVSVKAQRNVDSLRSLIPNATGIERVDLKNSVSRLLLYQSPPEAEVYIDEAIEESIEIDYTRGLALAKVLKGTLHSMKSEFDETKTVLNEAIQLAESIDYQEGLAYARMGLGALHINLRELTVAFEIHIEGIESARKIGNADLELTYLMNIGVIKQLLEEYAEAEKFFLEALEMSEEAGLNNRSAQIYGNLGIIELKQNNFGRSINYQTQALAIFRELRADTQSAISLLNIGLAESKLGNSQKAMAAYDEALQLRIKLKDSLGIAKTLRYQGELLSKDGRLSEARTSLSGALNLAEKFSDQNLLGEIHFLQYELYQKTSEFKNALSSYRAYVAIQDSLTAKANRIAISELTSQYDFEKLEDQNRLQQQENEIKDLKIDQRNYLIIGVVVLLLLVALWSIWNKKRLQNQLALTRKDNQVVRQEVQLRSQEFDIEKSRLLQYADQLLSKNEDLEDKRKELENRLESSDQQQAEIEDLIDKLRTTINDENDWTAFRVYFDVVFPDFFELVRQYKAVELTLYEQRLLALIKIALTNKEIAGILNISRNSVVRAKYRLRQKFDFSETREMEDFFVEL